MMLAALCSSTLPSEPQILTFKFSMYAWLINLIILKKEVKLSFIILDFVYHTSGVRTET